MTSFPYVYSTSIDILTQGMGSITINEKQEEEKNRLKYVTHISESNKQRKNKR